MAGDASYISSSRAQINGLFWPISAYSLSFNWTSWTFHAMCPTRPFWPN